MRQSSSNSSLRLAKDAQAMDFVGALAAILANPNQRVVSIMIIDRSESMRGYEAPVMDAVNGHLTNIQNPPEDSGDQYAMVITFNHGYRVAIPLARASEIAPLTSYLPKGRTLLYETVYLALKLFVRAYESLSDEQRQNLKIAFGIFTDGGDNESDQNKFPVKLVQLVQRARVFDFEFMTYGFHFDAKNVAREMGMPTDDDHAISFDKSPAGFEAASQHYTTRTMAFFGGQNFNPNSGSGSVSQN